MKMLPLRFILLLLFGLLRQNEAQDCGTENGPRMPNFYFGSVVSRRNGRIVGKYFDISWSRPKEDVIKYELEYTKSNIPSLSHRIQTTGRRYRLDDVDFSFDFKFRMRAFNESGFGPWSEEKSYVATSGRLAAPRNIHVRRLTPSKYSVAFDPPRLPSWPRTSIQGYRLFTSYHASNAMSSWNHTDIPADSHSAEFTVWDPSKTYLVRLQARERDGRYGNLSAVQLPDDYSMVTPGKARNFQGSIQGRGVVLRWDHPSNWQFTGLTSYYLEYKRATGYGSSAAFLPPTYKRYTITRLRPGTYNFNLTAKYLGEPVPEGPATIQLTVPQQ